MNGALGEVTETRGQRESPPANVALRQVVGQVNERGLWRNARNDAFHGANKPVAGTEIRG